MHTRSNQTALLLSSPQVILLREGFVAGGARKRCPQKPLFFQHEFTLNNPKAILMRNSDIFKVLPGSSSRGSLVRSSTYQKGFCYRAHISIAWCPHRLLFSPKPQLSSSKISTQQYHQRWCAMEMNCIERKGGDRLSTVSMVKTSQKQTKTKQLNPQCSNGARTIGISQPFSCCCRLSLLLLGNALVLEFKETFTVNSSTAALNVAERRLWVLCLIVSGLELPSGPSPLLAWGTGVESLSHLHLLPCYQDAVCISW